MKIKRAVVIALSALWLSMTGLAGTVMADSFNNASPVGIGDCTGAGCAQLGVDSVGGEGETGLMDTVQIIINVVIYVVGLIAVVMIILGGIQYTTSQGDAGKVKKAKDTILYGIIGLVVAILAFAVVNFVLTSVF